MANDAFDTWVQRRLARERDRCKVIRVLGARGDLDRAVALVNESEAELQAAIAEGIVRTCGGCLGSGSREMIVAPPGACVLDLPTVKIEQALADELRAMVTVRCLDCAGVGLVPGAGQGGA